MLSHAAPSGPQEDDRNVPSRILSDLTIVSASLNSGVTKDLSERHRSKWSLAKRLDTCKSVNDPQVVGHQVVVKTTYASCIGSAVALIVFLWYFTLDILVSDFAGGPSSVNEQTPLQPPDTEGELPQIAFTMYISGREDYEQEHDLLQHFYPAFSRKTINYGFRSRRRRMREPPCQAWKLNVTDADGHSPANVTEMEFLNEFIVTGKKACGFEDNYPVEDWPTFCTPGPDDPGYDRFKIMGAYGDPTLKHFKIEVHNCGDACGAQQQKCGGNTSGLWQEAPMIFFNVWFRFKREDWNAGPDLIPIPKVGGWRQYLWGFMTQGKTQKHQFVFTHNTAKVRHHRWFPWPEALDPKNETVWLSYHSQEGSESDRRTDVGSTYGAPYIEFTFSIDTKTREVDVQSLSVRELLSQLGASWPVALSAGLVVAQLLSKLANQAQQRKQKQAHLATGTSALDSPEPLGDAEHGTTLCAAPSTPDVEKSSTI
jgi:hypothetical protein